MVERMMGVEPTLPAWEAEVLPMNYIRVYMQYIIAAGGFQQKILRRRISPGFACGGAYTGGNRC